MNTMILWFVLLSQPLLPAPVQSAALPGSAYSIPAKGVALHSDAGHDFPEVVSLDGETVVRTGALKGTYREVFMPQGFAVFMHRDYLQVDETEGTATVTGDRVNMRLLPSREGLQAVGTLSRPTGPLVVLERTGEWVRVLAPVQVALYALDSELPSTSDATAADRWRALYASRDSRRQAAIESLRHDDPEWQKQSALESRVEDLAQVDVTALSPAALDERQAQLGQLAGEARWPQTVAAIETLRREVDSVRALRAAASQATTQVAQQQTGSTELIKRESRLLLLGFRYKGKGLPVTREGVVQAEGSASAPIYTLRAPDGELLKLTAPPEVAKLADLAGKRVQIDGRRLFLTPVDGPVLVIDRVTVPGAN